MVWWWWWWCNGRARVLHSRTAVLLKKRLDDDGATFYHDGQRNLVSETCLEAGRHVLCCLPTGTGKSMGWILPAMAHRETCCLVIVPFISLGLDIEIREERASRGARLNVMFVRGKNAPSMASRLYSRSAGGEMQEERPHLIVATPKALCDGEFFCALRQLRKDNVLQRCFLDELHVYLLDRSWRTDLNVVSKLISLDIQVSS
jgi:superfamily II DNA helicase RecQ